jgi:hypothetical protein
MKLQKFIKSLFVSISLFKNDLKIYNPLDINLKEGFKFQLISNINDLSFFESFINEKGEPYKDILRRRLESGDFLCFMYYDVINQKAAYTRWLTFKSFYHDRFSQLIQLNENEAFTLESYTLNEYRGNYLHREMNKEMLNYCKNTLKLSSIFMVIFNGKDFEHLHKLVKGMGYKKIKTKRHINFNFIKNIIKSA